eukprot:TRINITY_DN1157_c0_g1_i6.p1 TRINITY_DN1157_c0_g1~~TRINITY_DN1157_c0_g1_i6.p1  ORF type:complete len:384 (-),score=93.32 TRINITY_DN1157_c0_g1_i6:72-1223(-)
MEEKYFEDLFNEGNIPFPEFLSQFDSFHPISFLEEEPLLNSPLLGQGQLETPVTPLLLGSPRLDFVEESESLQSNGKDSEEAAGVDGGANGANEVDEVKRKVIRKVKTESELQEEDKKQTRAERNRRYAKESRERKKKYIGALEDEIRRLKYEIEIYKAKLKPYEVIEKCKASFKGCMLNVLSKTYKEMREKDRPISDTKIFMQNLNNSMKSLMEDQKTALMSLGKILVDIVMPSPIRVSIWISENNIDMSDPKEIVKALSPVINMEQAQAVVDYTRQIDPDGKKERETNKVTAESFKKMKAALKEVVKYVKIIMAEFENIGTYMNNNVLPNFTPYLLEILVNLATQIMSKKEIESTANAHLLKILFEGKTSDLLPKFLNGQS